MRMAVFRWTTSSPSSSYVTFVVAFRMVMHFEPLLVCLLACLSFWCVCRGPKPQAFSGDKGSLTLALGLALRDAEPHV